MTEDSKRVERSNEEIANFIVVNISERLKKANYNAVFSQGLGVYEEAVEGKTLKEQIKEALDSKDLSHQKKLEEVEAKYKALQCPGCDGSGVNVEYCGPDNPPNESECPYGCEGKPYLQIKVADLEAKLKVAEEILTKINKEGIRRVKYQEIDQTLERIRKP